MTYAAAVAMMQRGLPSFGGRLLWAYRIAWTLLAAATIAVLAFAVLDDGMRPAILGIRLAKSAILFAVAAVLFWRRQRDPVAAILSLAFLCWTITSSFDFTTSAILPMLLDRLRFLLLALALLLFPDGLWLPRWTRYVAISSCAVFAIGAVEAVGLLPTRLFLPLAILCVLAAIGALIRRFQTTTHDAQQQQLKWVALGLVSGVGLILTARAGAALSAPALTFEAMFQAGIVLVALGFLVPLLRYRLYDAESVISRSAGYAVLTATLVAIFAGSEALIESLGQQYLGSGIGQVSGAAAAAVAAVLLGPLNDRISNWAERRFQRDLVQLKEQLPELLAEIPADWSLRRIGESALPRIREAVHATRAAIILKDAVVAADGATLNSVRRTSDLFPLQLPLRCPFGGQRGFLLVGPRPDKTSYRKAEIEALEAILPTLRRALLTSSQRATDRRREKASRQALGAEIKVLSRQIESLRQPL